MSSLQYINKEDISFSLHDSFIDVVCSWWRKKTLGTQRGFFWTEKEPLGFGSSRNIMGKQVREVNSKWSITNIPLKYKKRKEKKGTVINKPNEPMWDKKKVLPRWRHHQKPSVQSRLVGLREWSLKWVERRLAKRDIADCRSWIWRAAFGLLNAELYTILFSWLNTGTQRRWRGRDESSVCICVCSHFADVEAWPW